MARSTSTETTAVPPAPTMAPRRLPPAFHVVQPLSSPVDVVLRGGVVLVGGRRRARVGWAPLPHWRPVPDQPISPPQSPPMMIATNARSRAATEGSALGV